MKIEELLDILACPACHGGLELKMRGDSPQGFICPACELLYPIKDEIPVMLVEEALPYKEEEN